MTQREEPVVELRCGDESGLKQQERTFLGILAQEPVGIGDPEVLEAADGPLPLEVDHNASEVENYIFNILHVVVDRM